MSERPLSGRQLPDPRLRAGDRDRAAVAAVLGDALSDGRLTLEEYEQRVASAYAARTYGELGGLTADLPASPPTPPVAAPAPPPLAWAFRRSAWPQLVVLLALVWSLAVLLTGAVHLWPVWLVLPWLLVRRRGGCRGSSAARASSRRSVPQPEGWSR